MKKLTIVLLVLILVGIGIGDFFLIKNNKDINRFRDSYINESYAAEKELWTELLETNTHLNDISAKLSVIGGHLVSNGF